MANDIITKQLKATFPFDTLIKIEGYTSMSEFSYSSEKITQIRFSSSDNTLTVHCDSEKMSFKFSQIITFTTDYFGYISYRIELSNLRIIDFKVVG